MTCSNQSSGSHSHAHVTAHLLLVTCSSTSISQDQLDGLQQAASLFCSSSQGCSSSSSSTERASAAASKPDDARLRATTQAMLAAMKEMHRVQACLEAPGPLLFHHVKQVRGSMLVLDMAAAALRQLPACFVQGLREDSDARDLLVPGGQPGCGVSRCDRRLAEAR
jgi:hypothetical protein